MRCPQCGKRGLKGHQGVAMHVGRVHSKSIIPPRGVGGRKRPAIQLEDHTDHEHPAQSDGSVAVLKRTRTMREITVTDEAKVPVQRFSVNGCPNCFFPIGLMHEDLAARKIAIPPYCPSCTCPIQPVKTALNLAARQPNIALSLT